MYCPYIYIYISIAAQISSQITRGLCRVWRVFASRFPGFLFCRERKKKWNKKRREKGEGRGRRVQEVHKVTLLYTVGYSVGLHHVDTK